MAHTPSQYIVNRGVLANDGTGDTLRDAFGKLNEAVEALYETDLGQLGNVDITGAVTGNTLIYNAITGNWEASSTVAASALNDLSDVSIAGSLAASQLLRYNGAAWVNVAITTDDVSEGANLYYTTLRVNSAFDTRLATKSTANLSEDPAATVSSGTMYYTDARANAAFDTRLATKSTANLPEDPAATNSSGTAYYTTTRHNTDFDTRLAVKSTADLAEDPAATGVSGTQYFTDARADARIANAFSGDVTIGGDLIVQGATVTVESNTVTIGDNIIVLNADEAGTPSLDSGIEVERGTSSNVQLLWNETTDKWQFTNDGATYVDMGTASIFTGNTDGVAEGALNYYYTTARANTDFDARLVTKSTANLAEDPAATVSSGTMYYTDARANTAFDTRLATKSTANLSEDPAATVSSGTMYYTDARVNTAFDTRLATKSTADVAEDPAATVSSGTMYYTDARVDTRIAATNIGSLNNVDTTGVTNNSILRYSTGSGSWVISATSDPVVVVGQETITGANGVLTSFTMSTVAPTTITAIVSVNGIIQEPTTAYTISGSTITFTSPPPSGARIGIRALGSGEQGFLIRSADFNAVATGRYGVDTSGGIVTATLPASPSAGEAIYFMDAGGAFGSNTFTVDRNGNTINGAASNLAKTTNGESFGLMYTGSTWRTY